MQLHQWLHLYLGLFFRYAARGEDAIGAIADEGLRLVEMPSNSPEAKDRSIQREKTTTLQLCVTPTELVMSNIGVRP